MVDYNLSSKVQHRPISFSWETLAYSIPLDRKNFLLQRRVKDSHLASWAVSSFPLHGISLEWSSSRHCRKVGHLGVREFLSSSGGSWLSALQASHFYAWFTGVFTMNRW